MKQNKNFGRVDDNGGIQYAPFPLPVNGNVWTNDIELHKSFGYYPVIKTEKPKKEGHYYTIYWELEDNTIIQKWKEHEIPAEEETENFEELLDIITEGFVTE